MRLSPAAAGLLIIVVGLSIGMYFLKANEPEVAMSASWRSQGTQASIDIMDRNTRGPTVCREYAKKGWFYKLVSTDEKWCDRWIEIYGKDHGISAS